MADDNPIKKRLLINFIMLGGIAALAAAVWFSPDQEEPKTHISNIKKNDISKIVIKSRGKETVILVKQDGGWLMTEPLVTYTKHTQINGILNLLTAESEKQIPITEINPAEFGLTQPAGIVQYNEHTFIFGENDPVEGKRYVQFGETLHILPDVHLPLALASQFDFYDFELLPDFINSKVVSYQLPDFTISKAENGGWKIEPEDPELTADLIQQWVNQWTYSQAAKIQHTPDLDTTEAPKFIVTLNNGKILQFSIIRTEDGTEDGFGYYRDDMQTAYYLSDKVLDNLTKKPEAPEKENSDESAPTESP